MTVPVTLICMHTVFSVTTPVWGSNTTRAKGMGQRGDGTIPPAATWQGLPSLYSELLPRLKAHWPASCPAPRLPQAPLTLLPHPRGPGRELDPGPRQPGWGQGHGKGRARPGRHCGAQHSSLFPQERMVTPWSLDGVLSVDFGWFCISRRDGAVESCPGPCIPQPYKEEGSWFPMCQMTWQGLGKRTPIATRSLHR